MIYALRTLVLGSAMLAAPAALADSLDTPHTLDKVTITGSRSVPTDKLMAVVQEHAGSSVTQNDIVADRDAITKVLEQAHVGGEVKAKISEEPKHKHLTVEFIVVDQGVQAQVVNHVAPKLHAETFAGNKVLTTDQLTAAAGLAPGQELSNEKITAAQQKIKDAYAAAKKPVDVNIGASISQTATGQADITWNIVETKGKAKKKDTRSDEEKDQIAPP